IRGVLSERELGAVLMHELAHAKRRDNLLRLLHEFVLCILWFHPLVWLAGARLALFRELSCDEPVIRSRRGRELASALAKLAHPASCEELLLEARLSSSIGTRLASLATGSRAGSRMESVLLATAFLAVLLVGVLATVAHTACCFVLRS